MSATIDKIWVNGEHNRALALPDRGLDYGDGVFETLLIRNRTVVLLELHMERLSFGLKTLGFPPIASIVEGHIFAALESAEETGEAVMRVTVTRGKGERGYAPPLNCKPNIIITLARRAQSEASLFPNPASLSLAKTRWGQQPALAGIKHLNRLEQVLAANERQQAGTDESLMLAQSGCIVSVSAGNIFLLVDGILYTPGLAEYGVSGTRRRLILEVLAPMLDIEVREAEVSLEQLKSAAEVFYCSSVQGLRPVNRFELCSWNTHTVCQALHQCYTERVL